MLHAENISKKNLQETKSHKAMYRCWY